MSLGEWGDPSAPGWFVWDDAAPFGELRVLYDLDDVAPEFGVVSYDAGEDREG